MNSESPFFELGKVTKTKGLKGEFEIFLDSDNPGYYKSLESVLIELNHELVPFFIKNIRIHGKTAVVMCDEIHSIDQAENLVGSKVFLPIDKLPQLYGNRYYFHELSGVQVSDRLYGHLGRIHAIYENTHQPVAEVIQNGKEILFPLMNHFIEKFDRENKILFVNLPEGLIDLYLEKKGDS